MNDWVRNSGYAQNRCMPGREIMNLDTGMIHMGNPMMAVGNLMMGI